MIPTLESDFDPLSLSSQSQSCVEPMKKIPILLFAGAIAGIVWSSVRQRDVASEPSPEQTRFQRTTSATGELRSAGASRTKSPRALAAMAKAAALDPNDPDAGLPSIEETLRAARSKVFNFKHHLCQCQCDLDETRIMAVLTKLNLTWPRMQEELGSVTMEHNLRFREEEALRLVEKDPHAAIKFMATQIRYETEKSITTTAAAPWRESLREGGQGDSSLYAAMLGDVSDVHFDAVVNENLSLVAASRALQESTLENSFKRPPNVRLKTLARLADEGLLQGSPYRAKAEAEMLSLIGQPPVSSSSWLNDVAERL
jgi:hypothetical protein